MHRKVSHCLLAWEIRVDYQRYLLAIRVEMSCGSKTNRILALLKHIKSFNSSAGC